MMFSHRIDFFFTGYSLFISKIIVTCCYSDFIAVNTNTLAKKPFFLIFYHYPISFDAVWVDQ